MQINERIRFNEREYIELLKRAKESYQFLTFDRFQEAEEGVIWRHDVDISPHRALFMAKNEAKLSVVSTYFILLNSSFYNFLEDRVIEIFRAIVSLGHRVGLHFQADQNDINNKKEFISKLLWQKSIIERVLGVSVDSFSFHQPTKYLTEMYRACSYSGLINAYADCFFRDIPYCSDSNGYWRYTDLRSFLDMGHKKIHVLTHPCWWQKEEMYPRQRIERSCMGRLRHVMSKYDNGMERDGRKNLGKDTSEIIKSNFV